jgi:hypothetical protein
MQQGGGRVGVLCPWEREGQVGEVSVRCHVRAPQASNFKGAFKSWTWGTGRL